MRGAYWAHSEYAAVDLTGSCSILTHASNCVQYPEYIAQALLTILLLLSQKWVLGSLQLVLTAYHFRLLSRKKHRVDVTEIFRQIKPEKKQRMVKLGFYLVSFIIVVYM